MTIKEMVKKWLEENGYKGLINKEYECSCDVDDEQDFMVCPFDDVSLCEAAWLKKGIKNED